MLKTLTLMLKMLIRNYMHQMYRKFQRNKFNW